MARANGSPGLVDPISGARRPALDDAPRLVTLKRTAMVAATAFCATSIWTLAPLLALWVGSHVVTQSLLSMKAVVVVIVVLAVLVFMLAVALTWLNNTYDELIGRSRNERRSPWLRSMRAEAEGHLSNRVGITALERIVMASVYLAIATLLVWWLFFSAPPLPH
jgi:hypothetical protein